MEIETQNYSLEGLSPHRMMGKILCEMYEISEENRRLDRDQIAQLNELSQKLIEEVGKMMHRRGSYSGKLALSTLLLAGVSIPFTKTILSPVLKALIEGGVLNNLKSWFDQPVEAQITVKQFQANQEEKDASHMQSFLDKDSTLELMQSTFAKTLQADEVRV